MKSWSRYLSIVLLSVSTAQGGTTRGRTFYSVRPFFQMAMPERVALFRNDLLEENQGLGGACEIVPFGSSTTANGTSQIARYFLPPGCTTNFLRVKEYNQATSNSEDANPLKDLEARHFNIQTVEETFSSTIALCPKQTVAGVGLCFKQTLSAKCDGTPGFWIELSIPIMRVTNQLHLTETIENDGGGPVDQIGLDNSPRIGTMIEALNQETWHYGKIPTRCQSETGVADVELLFGYNSYNCDTYTLASFGTLVIPTGNHVRGRTLFEPVVGNNRHFGVSLGNSFAYKFWCKDRHAVHIFLDNNTRYLFSNYQTRSFDLIGKPWSRYMETYKSSEEAAQAEREANATSGTSGINVFTRSVRVSPHLSGSFNTGIVLSRFSDCATWLLEGGYNLFVRQAEVLEFECSNQISAAALKAVDGLGKTTVARTIKGNFMDSEYLLENRYASLSNCNIDVESASQPATISSTIYATIGYCWERECPLSLSLGSSYEFTNAEINASPDRWLIWGKFCVTF